jgi:hypothetical protein
MVPALLLVAGAVQASPSDPSQCVFEKYAASSVAPFRSEENVGYGSYTRLRGAQVFVPAREGLTAEWLTLNVQRALSKHAGAPSESACAPSMPVEVSVTSAGAGFWIQLRTNDEAQASALLRWARSVVPARHPSAAAR